MLGQGVLQKHINKEPSNASLMCSNILGSGSASKIISKEPSNTSLMCSPFFGQGVLRKDISKEPSNTSLMCSPYFGQGVLRRYISKEPNNTSLMCSPFFSQGVLQECGKHISDSHLQLTHLKLKQQLLGQYDNFFFTVWAPPNVFTFYFQSYSLCMFRIATNSLGLRLLCHMHACLISIKTFTAL